MNYHARWFVNDHQIFIFMNDLDRNFFRSNGCSRQRVSSISISSCGRVL
jgi:hypothetical protein